MVGRVKEGVEVEFRSESLGLTSFSRSGHSQAIINRNAIMKTSGSCFNFKISIRYNLGFLPSSFGFIIINRKHMVSVMFTKSNILIIIWFGKSIFYLMDLKISSL